MSSYNNYDRTTSAKRLDTMKDKSILEELVKGKNSIEFSIEAPPEENDEIVKEFRVDTAFEYNEYANHVNLDCLNESDDINTSPFDIIAEKMNNITSDGGIKKKVLRSGFGSPVPENAVVFLHYNCYLELEEVPFDSSYLRSPQPVRFCLGEYSTYPGFNIAIYSMCQGEKSQFLIKPEYAFKEMGVPPRIPKNATILLEVDLARVINCGDGIVGVHETADYESYKSFPAAFKKAKSLHLLGNDYFHNKNYTAASDTYRKSVNLLTSCSLANDEEEKNQKHLLMKVYTNLCICYSKLNIPQKVCIYARDATDIDPVAANSNGKLHFNWGKALVNLGDYKRAGDHFKKAKYLNPNNKEINEALINLEKERKSHYQYEKITYKKALGLEKIDQINKTDNSAVETGERQIYEDITKELERFSKSSRSILEFPPGLTKGEKETVQKVAGEIGLSYNEVKRLNGKVCISVTK